MKFGAFPPKKTCHSMAFRNCISHQCKYPESEELSNKKKIYPHTKFSSTLQIYGKQVDIPQLYLSKAFETRKLSKYKSFSLKKQLDDSSRIKNVTNLYQNTHLIVTDGLFLRKTQNFHSARNSSISYQFEGIFRNSPEYLEAKQRSIRSFTQIGLIIKNKINGLDITKAVVNERKIKKKWTSKGLDQYQGQKSFNKKYIQFLQEKNPLKCEPLKPWDVEIDIFDVNLLQPVETACNKKFRKSPHKKSHLKQKSRNSQRSSIIKNHL